MIAPRIAERGFLISCANTAGPLQKTALMFSCATGSQKVCQALLAAGAVQSKRDLTGKTAKDYAKNHPKILKLLQECEIVR